ncbi:MAG: hypothetical protein QG597_2585 [Actinomycetota bacterium]|nr:hypothetical protein [Actinomycetota bacterium]
MTAVPTETDAPDTHRPSAGSDSLTGWPSKAINQAAWALVGLGIVVRGLITISGSFYWDDFILQGRAARLNLDGDFLIRSHDGHLMPAAAAVSWLTERVAPLEFWLPALELLALQAACAVFGWLLIRRIFGIRTLSLVPLLLLLFSPLTLPSSVWWTAGLNALPMQLGMLGVTWGAWLLCRQQRERAGRWWILGSIVVALLFFEKSLLLGLWAALAVWVFSADGRPWAWLREQWRRRRWFWTGLAALAIVYVGAYLTVSDRAPQAPQQFGQTVSAFRIALFEAILPSMLGGPGGWQPIGWGAAFARPSALLILISLVAVSTLVVFGWRTATRARRGWTAAAVYIGVVISLMASTRLAAADAAGLMAGLRYLADAIVPLTLAVGLSLMPVAGDPESARMLGVRRWLASRPRVLIGGPAAAVIVAAILTMASISGFWAIWSSIAAEPWLANARETMSGSAEDGVILDQAAPEFVLGGLAHPYNDISWTLAPLPRQPGFGQVTDNPRFLQESGALVPGRIAGVDAEPGPASGCGWRLRQGRNVVPLASDVFEWEHRLEVVYRASAPTAATVALGTGRPTPVTFGSGDGRFVARVEGGGRSFTIDDVPAGAGICVSRGSVGTWYQIGPPAG